MNSYRWSHASADALPADFSAQGPGSPPFCRAWPLRRPLSPGILFPPLGQRRGYSLPAILAIIPLFPSLFSYPLGFLPTIQARILSPVSR